MRWAILNEENKVVSIVEQDDRPANGVKAHMTSDCEIGWQYNGWDFNPPKWTAYEFLNRFTSNERAAIRAAATDTNVADFLMLAQVAQEVIANDPVTIAGMDYLVLMGCITLDRRNEILRG